MKQLLLFFLILNFHSVVYSQTIFNGVLINSSDSAAIPFAIIKSIETGKYQTTNSKGEFSFSFPSKIQTVHFEINVIGYHGLVEHKTDGNNQQKIYINLSSTELNDIVIEGLSAKQVVEQAINSIPDNYTDSSFVAYSFYRQYQKVNGTFRNLIEAQVAVLFKLKNSENTIADENAIAVLQMRRTPIQYIEQTSKVDEFIDLLTQNPVYNQLGSILNQKGLYFYHFSFDTSSNAGEDYRINFSCKDYACEKHGVENYDELQWHGESWATGQLIIDRESYAFKMIEVYSARYTDYNYPRYNNFLPSKKYSYQFTDAHLLINYESKNGKWFLKNLLHEYSYEFDKAVTGEHAFDFTDAFEFYCDSISHFIAPELFDSFYLTADLPNRKYHYHQQQWKNPVPPFYFFNSSEIYQNLEKSKSLNEQFEDEGK